jgi:hypothetical protein
MLFRMPRRPAAAFALLTASLAFACTACTTKDDNGPLDPHAAAASAFDSASPVGSGTGAAQSSNGASSSQSPAKATVTATVTGPIKQFAAASCHDTVFAQVGGDAQFGFTACGKGTYGQIYAIVGDGKTWKLARVNAHGIPLAAAGGTYLLYSAKAGNISVLHRADGGKTNAFTIQQGPPNTFAGAIAAQGGWWADWSEPYFHDVWQAHTLHGKELATVASTTYAPHLSLTLVGGRPSLAWVEPGGLYVGVPKGAKWTRRKITADRVGPPVAFVVGGHLALAYPDYTLNQARVALNQGGAWHLRSLGSLGSSDASLVSAGAAGTKAVVAWQSQSGLGVGRLTNGHWAISGYGTARDRALASSGRAVVRDDGSLLLLGTHTSRIIG